MLIGITQRFMRTKTIPVWFMAFFFTPHLILGQITLDSSNFPLAGISYNRFIVVGGSIGNAGANQLYDFSNTFIWINDTLRYINPVVTTFAAFHPGASVATVQYSDFTLIWYYTADTNAFWTSGGTLIGDFGSGMTAVHANHPLPYTDTLVSNEYTYGHTETEISGIRFQNLNPGVDYQTISGKYIDCDGWGTLYAPLDTFTNVLRVKYIEFKYDTVFSGGVPVDATVDTLYYYKYFAQGIRHPVVIAHTNEFDKIQWIEALVIPDVLSGCTDTSAQNYNPIANQNDGTCIYCNQIIYTITPDATVCTGDSVTLTATGATNYLWSTSDTISSVTVTPDSSQTYSVYLSTQSYCWEIATVDISVFDEAQAEFWPDMSNPNDADTILFVNTSSNATNYFWDFGDSTTSAEKNPRHLYAGEGTKTVMLIASNLCSADTFYMTLTVVGMEEFQVSSESKFKVYPNPSNGKFTLTINSPLTTHHSQISIYNVLGEKVTPSNSQPTGGGGLNPLPSGGQGWAIDISNQPQGIYIVQLIIGDTFYQQRIVKN